MGIRIDASNYSNFQSRKSGAKMRRKARFLGRFKDNKPEFFRQGKRMNMTGNEIIAAIRMNGAEFNEKFSE